MLLRLTPLIGAMAALTLAGSGEVLIGKGEKTPLNLLLYILSILVFTASAIPLESTRIKLSTHDLTAATGARRLWLGWAVLVAGAAAATGLGLGAKKQLELDLKSVAGTWLWLVSLAVLSATGLGLHRLQQWPARWTATLWPTSRRGRWLFGIAIFALLAIAAAARLLFLDAIPFGINPDEGDRAGSSIQILRGVNTRSVFDTGWYRISMLYFWLLAQVMKVLGIGYTQARVFSALSSLLTVAVIIWIGIRHFGLRVGLLAGTLAALMGVLLQFGRVTTEATPTALLWTLSMALFFEAARRGRLWAWIGAGLAGGFSLYFYPSGRLWPVLAAGFCAYLFVHGLGGQRRSIAVGAVLAALASMLVMLPFFVLDSKQPGVFTLRAQETSIFSRDNVTRLGYFRPEWSIQQLLAEQTSRAVGLFHETSDNGGIWPMGHPIMSHPLALLTLLGLGWSCLSWRDPRLVGLAMWFWTGFVGVIVTVETPNLQRATTAMPTLPLFAALALDSLARRIEPLFAEPRPGRVRGIRLGATGLAALVVGWLTWTEARFYFVDYAAMDLWRGWRIEAESVRTQGNDTLVTSLSRSFHMVNSGWIRLIAPESSRGGIQSPGSELPLALPAKRQLAFMIYPRQEPYLPLLRELYPGGRTVSWDEPTGGHVLTMYNVSQEQWAATQGALARPPDGPALPVETLGAVPIGWSGYSGPMRWTAGLRAPRYWNYAFLIGPGPARLTIDGVEVLSLPVGTRQLSARVALARGIHAVEYQGVLTEPGKPALFRWSAPEAATDGPTSKAWEAVPTQSLVSAMTAPGGLLGIIRPADRPEQRRIDGTLATCCLTNQVGAHPYVATWTGTLTAPRSGVYGMSIVAQGAVELRLDGQEVIHADAVPDTPVSRDKRLEAGPHAVEIIYRVGDGAGPIEWAWAPPGGEPAIVPPSALSPLASAGVGPALRPQALGGPQAQPTQSPLSIEP